MEIMEPRDEEWFRHLMATQQVRMLVTPLVDGASAEGQGWVGRNIYPDCIVGTRRDCLRRVQKLLEGMKRLFPDRIVSAKCEMERGRNECIVTEDGMLFGSALTPIISVEEYLDYYYGDVQT